ncbi:MAG: uncharacterized protein KVP18_004017 [Porospora cf. gigantea A]|uniref:uncharacterized protein n=1 Tax=Porospora cf. gigantea A TaxID=2853593 RepID=UPI003559ECB8|nr:MAG: hypothetical protein KVP18_004017 [Porospora cf. gigantea A]
MSLPPWDGRGPDLLDKDLADEAYILLTDGKLNLAAVNVCLRSIGIDCTHHFPHSDVAHALAENGVTADDRVVAMDVIGDFQQIVFDWTHYLNGWSPKHISRFQTLTSRSPGKEYESNIF